MNPELAQKVANAVLYEGYILYPYRPSAMKNRQRWTFGILYPPAYGEVRGGTERATMHSEVLVKVASDDSPPFAKDGQKGGPPGEVFEVGPLTINLQLRFLHLVSKGASEEGVERSVEFAWTPLASQQSVMQFKFPSSTADDITQHEVSGTISIGSQQIRDDMFKLSIEVTNTSALPPDAADRNSALLRSLLSAHTILTIADGEFISLLEPPDDLREAANACKNIGNFPVLVGNDGERDMMLCSPIVLYDYPQIAPESAGDFYDATEMDEMLTLRVMTLTDEEKNEMRLVDDRVRNLLQRTQATTREQLMRTHGTIRSLRPASDNS